MTAWYEIEGPTRKYVVEDTVKKILQENIKINLEVLTSIIEKNIPIDKTDFGSWRGFGTFGLDKTIMVSIKRDIENL